MRRVAASTECGVQCLPPRVDIPTSSQPQSELLTRELQANILTWRVGGRSGGGGGGGDDGILPPATGADTLPPYIDVNS